MPGDAPNGRGTVGGRASRFVSRDIAGWLAANPAAQPEDETRVDETLTAAGRADDFDLIIVGSGYGASIAAHVMAGRRIRDAVSGRWREARVAVLERGRERLPGMFPATFAELAGEVRGRYPVPRGEQVPEVAAPTGMAEGLFDFKLSDAICGLVANGLGGGSLINAGVMLEPRDEVFASGRWPAALRDPAVLKPFYRRARRLLGATVAPDDDTPNTVAHAGRVPARHEMLHRIGGDAVGVASVPITVQLYEQRRDDRGAGEGGLAGKPGVAGKAGVAGNPGDLDRELGGHGLRQNECIGCGDCATGCNHDAKRSLDVMLLAGAAWAGVEVYTGVTVLRFDRRAGGGWGVLATHTDPVLRRRAPAPFVLRARRLIVAAGSYGSTELLARSRERSGTGLRFSAQLGEAFSGNGDMIVAVSDLPYPAHGSGDPAVAAAARHVGPTITGALDLRAAPPNVSIQELGIPAPLRELLAQTLGLVRTTSALVDADAARAPTSDADTRVDDDVVEHSLVLAVMGDDRGRGRLELPDETGVPDIDIADGAMVAGWRAAPPIAYYQGALDWLRARCARDLPTARVHANPLWRPLGRARRMFADAAAFDGPRITVHPLGGCPMGDDVSRGVVDAKGRVFDAAAASWEGAAVHDGLAVLDGSMLPGAVGINPALTIAAVSLRAAEALALDWGFAEGEAVDGGRAAPNPSALRRPVFAHVDPHALPPPRVPTLLALSERLVGRATVMHDEHPVDVIIELTLHSEPFDARATRPQGVRIALHGRGGDTGGRPAPDEPPVVPQVSLLRIYRYEDWLALRDPSAGLAWRERDPLGWRMTMKALHVAPEETLDAFAVFVAPVSGSLDVLIERPMPAAWRSARGLAAWAANTGVRSVWQGVTGWLHRVGRDMRPGHGMRSARGTRVGLAATINALRETVPAMHHALRHAGRRRDMIYTLAIQPPTRCADEHWAAFAAGSATVLGRKRVRYRHRGNTLRQLMRVELERFPNLFRAEPLRLDLDWLARERTPLLRIVDEANAPDGWADIAHFLGNVGRPVLMQSLFGFTAPDAPLVSPPARTGHAHRLARSLSGLDCEACELPLDGVSARLMRYRDARAIAANPRAATLPPVLLVHGYSAGGSTWAHPALTPGLVACLTARGRDVWVIDLRSSCGLDTAIHPWTFEDMAFGDLPAAIRHLTEATGQDRVDVVAHCMGAVMFSMTMLADPGRLGGPPHEELRGKVRRIVLSQAGPVMRFSAINRFRAFLMEALRYLLPVNRYQFTPVEPDALGEKILDRLLSTLPYPDDSEFALENPWFQRTPYTRLRRRMDLLYGKAFSLANLDRRVLDDIDDFFGPMSTQTLTQSIGFARHERIADVHGRPYPLETAMPHRWRSPTLWIHGAQNGIFEPGSVLLARRLFDECGLGHLLETEVFDGFGHQDCLIGRHCRPVLERIGDFLGEP